VSSGGARRKVSVPAIGAVSYNPAFTYIRRTASTDTEVANQ
jgi:hypothetical protein